VDVHSCNREFNIKIKNFKWLSDNLERSLQENLTLKLNDIRIKVVRKWNMNVLVFMAHRARVVALDLVEGSFKDQFRRIYDYAHELLRSNPRSAVKVKVDSVDGDTLYNNTSETFNNVIIDARGKPVITMLEEIRLYMMKRWPTNKTRVLTLQQSICPKIQKRLQKELHLTKYWISTSRKLYNQTNCISIDFIAFGLISILFGQLVNRKIV